MCLSPITIKNPRSKTLKNYYERRNISIPCGQCAECLSLKKQEWYFRTYWQCQEAFDHDGYVLFDTLTYDNDHLPYISDKYPEFSDFDFSCFSYEDLRLFFVRLRRSLSYAGYKVNDNLKYFVVSEYGSDDLYTDVFGHLRRGTKRPHYHGLFFVNDRHALPPLVLSRYIGLNWHNGLTDGVPFKDRGYVLRNRVYGPHYMNDPVVIRKTCNYVSKYVMKDHDYDGILESRISSVLEKVKYSDGKYDWSYFRPGDIEDFVREVRRKVGTFHRQSQGFGAWLLDHPDPDVNEILKRAVRDGYFLMPSDSVVDKVPVSGYYKIKMFYKKCKGDNGVEYWKLTDLGKYWKLVRAENSIKQLSKRYSTIYLNIGNYVDDCDKVVDLQDKIMKYLDGRDFADFAKYLLFYRGRIKPFDEPINLDWKYVLKKEFESDSFRNSYESELGDNFLYCYAGRSARRHFQCSFVSWKDLEIEKRIVDGRVKVHYDDLGCEDYGWHFYGYRGSFFDNCKDS